MEKYEHIWERLPFIGFDDEVLEDKKKYWYQYAREVLEKLQTKNVALVADTAAGKTVITILVLFAGNFRCLFLAPSRYLCGQHQKLFRQITGQDSVTRVITGVSPKKERFWHYPWEKVVFSTPHMAVKEWERGKLDPANFELVIIDEFHKASGNYPYTGITNRMGPRTKILALSASPGDSIDRIKKVEKNCRIQAWVRASIPTPEKKRDLVVAQPDETIRVISECFEGLLRDVLRELQELFPAGLGFDPKKEYLFSYKETQKWKQTAHTLKQNWKRLTALKLIAKYIKLYHAYSTTIVESYATFLDYVEKLRSQKAKSAQSILASREFSLIIKAAQGNINAHPKALQLLKVLGPWINMRKSAIVFVGERATGKYLKDFLNTNGIKAENIHGGGGAAALKKQEAALAQLSAGEVKVLLSTSVIEEGASVPKVDMIIHYSRPSTGVGSKQRDGRTGRFVKGNIVYLVMEHALDKTDHWISQGKVKRGDKALEEHTRKKQVQLSLFPEEEQ